MGPLIDTIFLKTHFNHCFHIERFCWLLYISEVIIEHIALHCTGNSNLSFSHFSPQEVFAHSCNIIKRIPNSLLNCCFDPSKACLIHFVKAGW